MMRCEAQAIGDKQSGGIGSDTMYTVMLALLCLIFLEMHATPVKGENRAFELGGCRH